MTKSVISASGYVSLRCTASSIALFPLDANLDPPARPHGAIRAATSNSCASAHRRFHLTQALPLPHTQVPLCACNRESRISMPGLQSPGKPHPRLIPQFPAENLAPTIAVRGFQDCPESIRHWAERIALDASWCGVRGHQTGVSAASPAPLFPKVDLRLSIYLRRTIQPAQRLKP